MIRRIVRPMAACSFVAIVAAAGCGDGKLKVYPVTGQVLYNGEPLPGVDIALHPVDPKNDTGYPPHATTDEQGKFSLMTYVKDDGAPSGEFRVAIAYAIEKAGDDGGDQIKKLAFQVPAKYLTKETSGITVTIKSGSNELTPITLEGPPRSKSKK